MTFLRKLRGIVGIGAFSAVVWALFGGILGFVILLIDPASVDPGEGPLVAAYYFGRAGFVAGLIAGAIVAAAERRHSLTTLKLSHMAFWGATAGVALPWLAVAPVAMTPFFVTLGAATVSAALGLARRGEAATPRLDAAANEELKPMKA